MRTRAQPDGPVVAPMLRAAEMRHASSTIMNMRGRNHNNNKFTVGHPHGVTGSVNRRIPPLVVLNLSFDQHVGADVDHVFVEFNVTFKILINNLNCLTFQE